MEDTGRKIINLHLGRLSEQDVSAMANRTLGISEQAMPPPAPAPVLGPRSPGNLSAAFNAAARGTTGTAVNTLKQQIAQSQSNLKDAYASPTFGQRLRQFLKGPSP